MFTGQGFKRLQLTDVRASIHHESAMMHRYPFPANTMGWILHPAAPITLMLPYPMLPRVKHFSRPHSLRVLVYA